MVVRSGCGFGRKTKMLVEPDGGCVVLMNIQHQQWQSAAPGRIMLGKRCDRFISKVTDDLMRVTPLPIGRLSVKVIVQPKHWDNLKISVRPIGWRPFAASESE